MNIAKRIWKFLFPPSRWNGCEPMTEEDRLAAFEIRMGRWRAAERLRKARVAQVFDARAASAMPKVKPKLPGDSNVVQMRRRKTA